MLSWVPKPHWNNLGVQEHAKCLWMVPSPWNQPWLGVCLTLLHQYLLMAPIIRLLFQFNFWVPPPPPPPLPPGQEFVQTYLDSITIFLLILLFFFSAAVKSAQLNPEKHVPCTERQLAWKNSFTHTHTQGPIRCGEATLYKQKLTHIRNILILIFWKWYQYYYKYFYYYFFKIYFTYLLIFSSTTIY